jgi:uncharacterized protein RhaS with RHS repeats
VEHEGVVTPPSTCYEHYWFGSLENEMRDASGQMYMRNRYYDPQSGQSSSRSAAALRDIPVCQILFARSSSSG